MFMYIYCIILKKDYIKNYTLDPTLPKDFITSDYKITPFKYLKLYM